MPGAYQQYLDIAKRRQALPQPLFDDPHFVVKLEKPTVVVPFGDLHLGADGTNYDQLEQDVQHLSMAKMLLGDQLLIVGMGDYIDGYLSVGTPMNHEQILSPGEQRAAAIDLLGQLSPSFVIEGDHDLWHSKQELQHSWLYLFCQQRGYQYAQWGGSMTFTTPNGVVHGLVRHRYKGSVASDHLRPHKNLHLELGPADFTMLGHWHSKPGVHRTYSKRRSEGTFLAVQSGTYKHRDEYGKKLGDLYGEYGVPALVITPEATIIPFDRYEDAVNSVLR
jgi:hypothetical protein